MKIKIQFIGGAKEVTGSSYLVSVPDYNFNMLIDAGMKQGEEISVEHLDAIDIKNVNAIFITHGHIDHTGGLPYLVKKGYRGPVFCTTATADVMDLLLKDSAKITKSRFYSNRDILELNKIVQPKGFNTTFKVGPVYVTFKYVSHILGASAILFEFKDQFKILFSGDIGSQSSLIQNRVETANADLLVMESTYGNKDHNNINDRNQELLSEIEDTIGKGGNVLIPVFAVGRAQELLLFFKQMKEQNKLQNVKVVFDTPLGKAITSLYQNHHGFLISDISKLQKQHENMFEFRGLETTKNTNTILDSMQGIVILTSSGMMNGGKVLQYARKILPDMMSKIIFVGYQAEGTTGRKLLDGAKTIALVDDPENIIEVKAQIRNIDGFSAHAGQTELCNFAKAVTPKEVILVHGEVDSINTLKDKLESMGLKVKIPDSGSVFEYEIPDGTKRELSENEYIIDLSTLEFSIMGGLKVAPFGGVIVIDNNNIARLYTAQQLMEKLNIYQKKEEAEQLLKTYAIATNTDNIESYAQYEERWKNIEASANEILSKGKIRRILNYLKQSDIAGAVDEIDVWVRKKRGKEELGIIKDLLIKNSDKIEDLTRRFENMFDKWNGAPDSDV